MQLALRGVSESPPACLSQHFLGRCTREWPVGGRETALDFSDPLPLKSSCTDLLERII